MASKTVEEVILGKVISRAISDEDIEKLAVSLRPTIVARMRKALEQEIRAWEFFDGFAGDGLEDVRDALEEKYVAEIKKQLGIVDKPKKGKK